MIYPMAAAQSLKRRMKAGMHLPRKWTTSGSCQSRVALGCVSGGLLGRHGRSMLREVDFAKPGRQERPFRNQLQLSRHPMYVCVLGSDLEVPN